MIPFEIFGYPLNTKTNSSKIAKKKYYCRFLNNKCDKQSRTISYPMGVCSVKNKDIKPIICPNRFLESNIVFNDVCKEVFGSVNNVLLFSEIHLVGVGSFDFVLVKHKPISNKIEDFCIVEFQSDSTTGTGKLVEALKDYLEGSTSLKDKYNFGLNTYSTIKLSYIQMLIKGQLMEKWNKSIVWIMQKYVFENMTNRFNLSNMAYSKENKTKYFIYDLFVNKSINNIKLIEKRSSSIPNLLKAFTNQPTPNIDDFIEHLENKVKLKLGLIIE
jgi:hypothetical protein